MQKNRRKRGDNETAEENPPRWRHDAFIQSMNFHQEKLPLNPIRSLKRKN